MNPVAEPNKKICLISFYVCIKTLRKSEQRSGVTKQSRAAGKSYRILIIVKTKEWKATANCRMSIRIKTVIPIDPKKINGFKRREASLSGQVRRTP